MNRLHQKLMDKSSAYRKWHEDKDYHLKHWAIFIAVVLVTLVSLPNLINRQVVSVDLNQARAAATTITAASCSQADVQTAINSALDGDTVTVPAGTCTWTQAINVTKTLSIIGAGSGAGGTNLVASGSMTNGFFNITGFTASSLVRISGFTFQMTNTTPQYGIKVTAMTGGCSNGQIRIDHNTFWHGRTQIYFYHCKGLIDHNYFYDGIKAADVSAGRNANATESWASMAAGTADAVFFEDNQFIQDANFPASGQEQIGTENGGKLVVRYNVFDGTQTGSTEFVFTPIMTHGSAAGGLPANQGYWQQGYGARRGHPVVEVYENTVNGVRADFLFIARGSANLVYNNILDTTRNAPRVLLREEEPYETSNWNPLRTAWPAEDQVHNTFIWNNTLRLKGTPNPNYVEVESGATNYIQLNRDYFLHAPQSSGGYEYFTGQNGASGSYPTNGVLYPTLGTMIFSSSGPNAYYPYTPYTYPHPLTLTGGTPPPPPPPPPPTPTQTPLPVSAIDSTPPTVSITSPTNGSTIPIKASLTIQATASDDIAVAKVDFFINGTLKCTDTIAPYTCSWNVPGKTGRTYRFQTKATDTSGNFAASAIVTVTAK